MQSLQDYNQIHDWEDVWNICNRVWSDQCKLIFNVTFMHLFNAIRIARNNVIFKEKFITTSSPISFNLSACSRVGNNNKASPFINIYDFEMFEYFKVRIQPLNAPKVMEVIWKPLPRNWIKINYEGASLGSSGPSACGGISRDYDGLFLGYFAHF